MNLRETNYGYRSVLDARIKIRRMEDHESAEETNDGLIVHRRPSFVLTLGSRTVQGTWFQELREAVREACLWWLAHPGSNSALKAAYSAMSATADGRGLAQAVRSGDYKVIDQLLVFVADRCRNSLHSRLIQELKGMGVWQRPAVRAAHEKLGWNWPYVHIAARRRS
jgi:hypothetical protein